MTRLLLLLLTLLFSLSRPGMGEYSDFERSSLAPRAGGIYEFTGKTGKPYVGQSGNIGQRLQQHIGKGKLPEQNIPTVKTAEVPGGKTAREIAEQKRLNQLGGPGNTENIRNPISPNRQHLIEE